MKEKKIYGDGEDGFEELMEAVEECEIGIVRGILDSHSSLVNRSNWFGMTPLHKAVYECPGDTMVNMMLDIPEVDLMLVDRDGDTAFNLAVANRMYGVVRRMLGIEPRVVGVLDKYGDSAVHVAARDTEMLRILFGSPHTMGVVGLRGVVLGDDMYHRYMCEEIAEIRKDKGMTVLEMAMACGNEEGVEFLRNRGIRI